MWPLPELCREIVTIDLSEGAIVCSWIRKNKKKYQLCAYEKSALSRGEFSAARIFNPTQLQYLIVSFLNTHKVHNSYVVIAVSGEDIFESIKVLPVASPDISLFSLSKLKKMCWEFCYLGTEKENKFLFYLAGITRQTLFQYKLFAIVAHLNLIMITTRYSGLHALYRLLRKEQLIKPERPSVIKDEKALHLIVSDELVKHVLNVGSSIDIYDMHDVKQALGLFLLGAPFIYEAD